MSKTRINELKELLDNIVIFAPNFKRDIFQDALELETPRFDALLSTLKEILNYQKNELGKKLSTDPAYFVRLNEAASRKRRAAIGEMSGKAMQKDRDKINELINKIKNI